MPPEFRDYYAVLGVPPDADDKAIKAAYRKLARQHHPDVNPGDKAAEERFKEINEAYQALSDPERRRKYDALRQDYQRWQQQGRPPPPPGAAPGAGPGAGGFDWGAWEAEPGSRVYTRTVSPEDLHDIFGDQSPFSDFFRSIYGEDVSDGRPVGRRAGRPRRGEDLEVPVEITLEEAFHGTSRSIRIGERTIQARIPPGVRPGTRVRLAGQGSPGVAGGPAGDLFLVVQVAPHPQFERDGEDLRVVVPVDVFTAVAGGEVRVPTLDGSVTLKIPPRTQAERVFRLKGKGMPRLESPGQRGDLYARVKLVLPEPLSERELETLRSLAEARRATARTR